MIELNGENYLDGDEACRLLGIKVSTLYTYVSRGILRSYKQGMKRQSLYRQSELEALLQLRPSTMPSPTMIPDTEENASPERPEIPHASDWMHNA